MNVRQENETRSIEAALAALGVTDTSLNDTEKAALDEQGYVVLKGVFPEDELQRLRSAFDEAALAASRMKSTEAYQSGTRHIENLLVKGEIFQSVCFHPRLLAAVFHVLKRRFTTQRIHGRDPLPGYGQQGLHADWMVPAQSGHYDVATVIGLLDDFTLENGATRVVPGTHRAFARIEKRAADPAYLHPQQVIVIAPAGSVLAFNGHLWHSATRNQSSRPRRTLQYSFVGFEYSRMSGATPPALENVSPAVRFILGE